MLVVMKISQDKQINLQVSLNTKLFNLIIICRRYSKQKSQRNNIGFGNTVVLARSFEMKNKCFPKLYIQLVKRHTVH